jgi:hypothetical protein
MQGKKQLIEKWLKEDKVDILFKTKIDKFHFINLIFSLNVVNN